MHLLQGIYAFFELDVVGWELGLGELKVKMPGSDIDRWIRADFVFGSANLLFEVLLRTGSERREGGTIQLVLLPKPRNKGW